MTGLLIAWVLFPLVLGAVSLGCGLLVEAASGIRLRGALLLPTGFAAIIVVAQLVTLSPSTARFVPWVVAAVALAGLVMSRPWRDRRPDWWPAAAGVGTFAVYAAPVVLSGSATFAGWLKLDDGATWLAITDRLMTHGRSLAGVPPSTYVMNLEGYLGSGYPVGSYLPLGVGGRLVGEELAWLIQPYIAFVATMLALAIYALVSRAIRSPALRALTAFVGAQAGLLYGYSLWGGVKEVVAAALIGMSAALVPTVLDRMSSPRAAIPLAVATAATLGSLSVTGGLVWLAPVLLPAVLLKVWRHRTTLTLRAGIGFLVLAALLAIPAITVAVKFFNSSRVTLTSNTEVANLMQPLKYVQIVGIWPTGDFRSDPVNAEITYLLIVIAGLAAIGGAVHALRGRAPEIAVYVAGSVLSAIVIVAFGSPWVDGKALTIASPAFLTAAAVGASALIEASRSRGHGGMLSLSGWAAMLAVGLGVLWSNVLAYHDVRLAPRDQLEELAKIGERPAAQGPALMLEPGAYGLLYFLRDLAPENPSMRRSRRVQLRNDRVLNYPGYADIDAFPLESILPYRTLVLNRSANASRPPSIYRLVWRGRYYEVWRRSDKDRTRTLEHLPQGIFNQPATVPACRAVRELGARAGRADGTLAAVLRAPAIVVSLSETRHPRSWKTYREAPGLIYPDATGTLMTTVTIPARGRYGVWLGGSFQRALEISIDGRSIGEQRHRINNLGAYTPYGEVDLERGKHNVQLVYTAANLHPGSGGITYHHLGPLVLGRHTANLPVKSVEPENAGSLCGKSVDWVEALRPRRVRRNASETKLSAAPPPQVGKDG